MICAWCEPTPLGGEPLSHGMCPDCAKKFEAEVIDLERAHEVLGASLTEMGAGEV